MQHPTFTNHLKFGYKYGISSHFVFNLMLARNNTDWVWVSSRSLVCFLFCCQCYQTVYISLQRGGRNHQISNALWKMVVDFLVQYLNGHSRLKNPQVISQKLVHPTVYGVLCEYITNSFCAMCSKFGVKAFKLAIFIQKPTGKPQTWFTLCKTNSQFANL